MLAAARDFLGRTKDLRLDTGRWVGGALGLACTLLLLGCESGHVTTLPKAGAETPCIRPATPHDTLVGVSLSGGGSRAALFGAAGLEALGRLSAPGGGSVLEQVGYVSSVSGGGLAAAYYGLNKPAKDTPVLGPDGKMTAAYEGFFTELETKLAQNFQSALLWRQLGAFRFILNAGLMARSLREVLEARLLGPSTFGDLATRQQRGDAPRVFFNATLYNDGRRFLFSMLPPDATQYDFIGALDRSLAARGITTPVPEIVHRRWEALLPVTPLELQIDPCRVRVSEAVTASAAFPPFVGPITFRVGDEPDYWHVGDGGLYENLGLEPLMFAFLKQLQEGKARRALILAFNSSYPFSVGFRLLRLRSQPWTLFNFDFPRIPRIMEERATDYWSLFYRSLQLQGVFPSDATLRVVFLNHGSAHWEEDLSDLPEACRHEGHTLISPEDVQERLAEIPTKLAIPSACDRELLHTAAAKVVAQHQQAITDFLAGEAPAR